MALVRQDIIDALKARLETIVAGATYHRDITTVEVFRTIPLEPSGATASQLPAAIIRDLSNTVMGAQGVDSPYNVTDHLLRIEIEVIASEGETDEEIREHIADIYKAIGTDETFGGVATKADPVGDEMLITEEDRRIAGARMVITVEYRTRKWQET